MNKNATIEKINIFLIGIIVFAVITGGASMAISLVSKMNANILRKDIYNIKKNKVENKEYYISKLIYLEKQKSTEVIFQENKPRAEESNKNSSNGNYIVNDQEFTKEMAFIYLKEYFKDNDAVVYTDIFDEVYINSEKYYVSRLFNKEAVEDGIRGMGNTVLIAKDKKVYDYNQIIDKE